MGDQDVFGDSQVTGKVAIEGTTVRSTVSLTIPCFAIDGCLGDAVA